MATNGTQSSSGNNGDAITLNLTWTALVISIGAFVLSTLQALLAYLQFDNSELGRRRCSEEVMGELWAAKTTKEFKWRDWRYQVFYETPWFYVAPSGITIGPLLKEKPKATLWNRFRRDYVNEKEQENYSSIQEKAVAMEVIEIQKHFLPIYKITGTENSLEHTMTPVSNKDGYWASDHMIQEEGCTWLLLLQALQEQERASRQWDNTASHGMNHPMCYFLQRFRRCWDHMPLNITKPYATTNICHLVEIMSMLGLIWKEFDVKKSSLSAEGNGYMVKGEYVAGLGGSSILMRFTRLSKPDYKANRMIPCCELNRLCFGEVPSLFDTTNENLQVSPDRLGNCLKRLLPRLDEDYRTLFLDTKKIPRPSIFPITFELIAMLAKSVHIKGSRLRRLPNPCADAWTPALDIAACLSAFVTNIKKCPTLGSHILKIEIQEMLEFGRLGSLSLGDGQSLVQKIKAYSDAATRLTREKADIFYYPADEREVMRAQAAQNYNIGLLDLLDSLHWAVERVDERLQDMVDTHEFREVIALHFQAVLDQRRVLNSELDMATRDNPKENTLISFYFKNIHPVAANDSVERSAIWLGLMFRMWSWLFLHNFNPEDKMIERSEFMNSRLPVYIG